jgi:hypothetical protein
VFLVAATARTSKQTPPGRAMSFYKYVYARAAMVAPCSALHAQVFGITLALVLYITFFLLRNKPLMKIRDIRFVTAFTLTLLADFCYFNVTQMMVRHCTD